MVQASEGRGEDGLLHGVEVIRVGGLHEVALVSVHHVSVLRSEHQKNTERDADGELSLHEALGVIEVEATVEEGELSGELVVNRVGVHESIL